MGKYTKADFCTYCGKKAHANKKDKQKCRNKNKKSLYCNQCGMIDCQHKQDDQGQKMKAIPSTQIKIQIKQKIFQQKLEPIRQQQQQQQQKIQQQKIQQQKIQHSKIQIQIQQDKQNIKYNYQQQQQIINKYKNKIANKKTKQIQYDNIEHINDDLIITRSGKYKKRQILKKQYTNMMRQIEKQIETKIQVWGKPISKEELFEIQEQQLFKITAYSNTSLHNRSHNNYRYLHFPNNWKYCYQMQNEKGKNVKRRTFTLKQRIVQYYLECFPQSRVLFDKQFLQQVEEGCISRQKYIDKVNKKKDQATNWITSLMDNSQKYVFFVHTIQQHYGEKFIDTKYDFNIQDVTFQMFNVIVNRLIDQQKFQRQHTYIEQLVQVGDKWYYYKRNKNDPNGDYIKQQINKPLQQRQTIQMKIKNFFSVHSSQFPPKQVQSINKYIQSKINEITCNKQIHQILIKKQILTLLNRIIQIRKMANNKIFNNRQKQYIIKQSSNFDQRKINYFYMIVRKATKFIEHYFKFKTMVDLKNPQISKKQRQIMFSQHLVKYKQIQFNLLKQLDKQQNELLQYNDKLKQRLQTIIKKRKFKQHQQFLNQHNRLFEVKLKSLILQKQTLDSQDINQSLKIDIIQENIKKLKTNYAEVRIIIQKQLIQIGKSEKQFEQETSDESEIKESIKINCLNLHKLKNKKKQLSNNFLIKPQQNTQPQTRKFYIQLQLQSQQQQQIVKCQARNKFKFKYPIQSNQQYQRIKRNWHIQKIIQQLDDQQIIQKQRKRKQTDPHLRQIQNRLIFNKHDKNFKKKVIKYRPFRVQQLRQYRIEKQTERRLNKKNGIIRRLQIIIERMEKCNSPKSLIAQVHQLLKQALRGNYQQCQSLVDLQQLQRSVNYQEKCKKNIIDIN